MERLKRPWTRFHTGRYGLGIMSGPMPVVLGKVRSEKPADENHARCTGADGNYA